MEPTHRKIKIVLVLVFLVLISAVSYTYYSLRVLQTHSASLQEELRLAQVSLTERENTIVQYTTQLEELKQAYALSEENGAELLRLFTEEKNRNEDFENQIDDISGTVGKLDKLSKIDPELLIKYSRVYFLNENYAPEKVEEIDPVFLAKPEEPEYINAKVAHYLDDLLSDAHDDGVDLLVVSAYRSFDEQMSLKSNYTITYGSGANAFSADQGYSEHQLGTTLDFTTSSLNGGLTGFESTEAYVWLQKNAHKYGFVISYPTENAYYVFEPWHWRFVGQDLADDLHDDGKYFYDLDQRDIDTYLIKLFD